MINNIKELLLQSMDISAWKIEENIINSRELFFVKKNLDMNRAKDVTHYKVTVYKDFEEEGKKYRGSSMFDIHPTMTDDEVKAKIEEASFAARQVKNEYYPLVKPSVEIKNKLKSDFSKGNLSEWILKLVQTVYDEDKYEKGKINSSEFFINRINTRIVNSEGVDVAYTRYEGIIEFVTDWKERDEEVEIYKYLEFSDFIPELISSKVKESFTYSREKSLAKPTPNCNNINVLLTGEPVKEFFKFYYEQSNATMVYEGISKFKLNECVQTNDTKGDLINVTLDPQLNGSTKSKIYDDDGVFLKQVNIIENGVLKNYWGDNRHSNYLGVSPTGKIENFVIKGGKYSIDELKNEPYLELVSFSDFQMDSLTGDFGGEIRLGWYYDGKSKIPVTGGSISGNINEAQKEIYLSKEIQSDNNFVGPKTIKLKQVSISGE